jgi:transposase
VLVDTLGLLLRVRVTAGDVGDRDGAAMLLRDVHTAFPRLRHGWVDAGYRGTFLQWADVRLAGTLPPPEQGL